MDAPPPDRSTVIGDPPNQGHKPHPNQIMNYNPQVVLMAVTIGLSLLFIRIGPFSFVLIIVVSCALSALPDFRNIVDSTLGVKSSVEGRLLETFPTIDFQSKSNLQESKPSNLNHLTQNYLKLDQLPDELKSVFDSLFDLIIRNHVASWYLLPTVSTGDKLFLNQVRNALDHILIKAHAKLITKSSKETMIYLIGCLSMNLVRELNDRSQSGSPPSAHDRIIQRQLQTRRISEEILLTLGSSSITSSPLTLSLATEVLTVQLISITSSFNKNWFNKTLIDLLGTGGPTQPSEAPSSSSPSTAKTTPKSVVDHLKENTQNGDIPEPLSLTPIINSSTSQSQPTNASLNMSSSLNDIDSVLGNEVLIAYLKSPKNFNLSASMNPNNNISLQDLFNHTPRWTASAIITEPEKSSLLRSSPDLSTEVECLIKLYNHFNSFRETSEGAKLKPDILQVDAISVLSALAPLMNNLIDQLIANQPDQVSKDHLCHAWKSVIVETLRRLELASAVRSDVFGNLQEWILDRLHSCKVLKSDEASTNLRLEPSPMIDQPTPTTNTHQAPEYKIHYMTLPNIPPSDSNNSPSHQPPIQSQDLASPTSENAWGKPKNSATEAVLSRHRTPSTSRTMISSSSPSSEWGLSSRRSSAQDPFDSPRVPFQSSSPFSLRVPEEGDMTEGYSLDEADDNADFGKYPHQPILPSSGSSTATFTTDPEQNLPDSTSHSNPIGLPPLNTSSQSASFTVSVTDMSPPSAFEPKTGLIKQKKDLSFLIAVEAPLVPGFIVTRGWPELEKMDAAINKKKLIGIGTKAFPRALLPTSLNFKTIDHMIRELEAYLECLMNDERYSKSEPVLKFFAKERSGMNGGGSAMNNIFNTTSSTLDSIGKGVASVGKEVVSKPVDFATLGLNRLSKGVFSGLPFGNSATASREENEEPASFDNANQTKSSLSLNSTDSHQLSSESPVESSHLGEARQDMASVNDHQSENSTYDNSTNAHDLASKDEKTGDQLPMGDSIGSKTEPRPNSQTILPSESILEISSKTLLSSTSIDRRESPHPQRNNALSSSGKTESTTVNNITSSPAPNKPQVVGKPNKPTTPMGGTSKPPSTVTTLTGKEFDAVIIGLISILEAAYGLDQKQPGSGTNTPWSMKRGVLRVLETILRTTSFSTFIRTHLSQTVDKFDRVETYVELFNSVLVTLSTSSTDIDDHQENNNEGEVTMRKKSKRMKSTSSIGSKQSLNSDHTLSSSSLSSESKEHQYRYQSLDLLEDREQLIDDHSNLRSTKVTSSQIDSNKDDQKLKENARKLFVDSWSSLKIGLGSNATDLAANKVFDLFQEIEEVQVQEHKGQEEEQEGRDGRKEEEIRLNQNCNRTNFKIHNDHSSSMFHDPPTTTTTTPPLSGIECIIHSLLLDLIRIILLL